MGFRGGGGGRSPAPKPNSTVWVKDFPVVVQDERGLGVAKFGRPARSAIFNYLQEEGPFGVSHKPTYICQKC
jgi:hypothetical protein